MKQIEIDSLIKNRLNSIGINSYSNIKNKFWMKDVENIKLKYKPHVLTDYLNELFKEVYSDQLLNEILNNPNPILERLKL